MTGTETRCGGQYHPASYGPKFILAFRCLLGLNLMSDRMAFRESIRRNIAGNMLLPVVLAWKLTWPFTRTDGERKGSPSC